jgi:hypothetical protein
MERKMSPKLKQFYLAGMNNDEFKQAVLEADGDTPPTFFDHTIIKEAWGLLYYGWLVGKYGKDYLKYV